MRKLGIMILAVALVVGMSFGVMAEDGFESDIEQIGSENTAKASQKGDATKTNEVNVFQDGDLNETYIIQGSLTKTDVDQIGDQNQIDVNVGSNQWTVIDQDGNWNDAIVNAPMGHSAWDSQRQNKHGTHLLQQGNNNEFTAFVKLSNSYSKQIGHQNEIVLDQSGNSIAAAYITQEGNYNYTDITQHGGDQAFILQRNEDIGNDGNVARLEQFGGSQFTSEEIETTHFLYQESTSTFAQLGDGNRLAGVNKSGDSLVLTPYEAAEQNSSAFNGYQDGNNNVIGLYQGGDDDALITQDGNRNEALLYQGDNVGHTTDIIQSGNDNDAEVIQTSN